MFANTEILHFETFLFKGTHRLSFEMSSAEAQADIGFGGINAFHFCEGVIPEVESLFNFVKCFVGGLSDHPRLPIIGSHVPPYMVQANVEFLSKAMDMKFVERAT